MAEDTGSATSLQAEISDLVVRTFREYTGRGATRVRTVLGPDTVTVLLEDTLTKGERSLVRHGRSDEVERIRTTYQDVMGDRLSAGIAALTGRPVLAFLSATHVEPDYAAEVFVLGDAGHDGAADDGGPPADG